MADPKMRDTKRDISFWYEVQEAYDTYRRRSCTHNPPGRPLLNFWKARGERTVQLLHGTALPAIILFRLRIRLMRYRISILPQLCDLASMTVWYASLGRQVKTGLGFYIVHGYVANVGMVIIGHNCTIGPWVSAGLMTGAKQGGTIQGPAICDDVWIGTRSNQPGPISTGDGVVIGSPAVAISDVPAGATVVGAPARVIRIDSPGQPSDDGGDHS